MNGKQGFLMDKIAKHFEHIKKYYHCRLCPGQFGWIPEHETDSLERHYRIFHLDGKGRNENNVS